jgi:3-oxoacyl-[acyl-carrier protein] reductase
MLTALVTGASRGIGFAIANRLERDGVRILTPTREALDLSNLDSVRNFISVNSETKVDILVNNAGENIVQPLAEIDFPTWDRIQTINLNSAFLLTQNFGKRMCDRGWGRILNVASLFSFLTKSGRASYTASKSALVGLTRTAAVEWSSSGVLVNSLSPGFVNTELTRKNNSPEKIAEISAQIPIGRLSEPSEIAEVAAFLVSQKNSYLTGQNIVVDGAYSVI